MKNQMMIDEDKIGMGSVMADDRVNAFSVTHSDDMTANADLDSQTARTHPLGMAHKVDHSSLSKAVNAAMGVKVINTISDFVNSIYSAFASGQTAQSGGQASYGSSNRLLSMSLPLLELALKLKELPSAPEKSFLQRLFTTEIEFFLDKMKKNSYTAETIIAARYVICAFIDEVIIYETSWGIVLNWGQESMLRSFAGDITTDGKKFFVILKDASDKAGANLDLLELMYVCLSLGFAGKYRAHKKGRLMLKETIANVYECISRYRKVGGQEFLIKSCPPVVANTTTGESKIQSGGLQTSRKFFSYKMWLTMGLVLIFGVVIYTTLNTQLNRVTQPLLSLLYAEESEQ